MALEELVLDLTALDVETLLAGLVDELVVVLCWELLNKMAELLEEIEGWPETLESALRVDAVDDEVLVDTARIDVVEEDDILEDTEVLDDGKLAMLID
jgi:hypothetical protein